MKSVMYKGQKYVLAGKVKNYAEELKANISDIKEAIKLIEKVETSLYDMEVKNAGMNHSPSLVALKELLKAHEFQMEMLKSDKSTVKQVAK